MKHTLYPIRYRHWFVCFGFGYLFSSQWIFVTYYVWLTFRAAPLALVVVGQSYDWSSASEVILKDIGKTDQPHNAAKQSEVWSMVTHLRLCPSTVLGCNRYSVCAHYLFESIFACTRPSNAKVLNWLFTVHPPLQLSLTCLIKRKYSCVYLNFTEIYFCNTTVETRHRGL